MGFEIKNICTVVPNPYHPNYEKDNKYYYFSVFITPRLQFDGTLKEFYEMLHWPDYSSIFSFGVISCYGKEEEDKIISIESDDYYISDIERKQDMQFEKERKRIWDKLFPEDTPVVAWPIYLKPQHYNSVVIQELENDIFNLKSQKTDQSSSISNFIANEQIMNGGGVKIDRVASTLRLNTPNENMKEKEKQLENEKKKAVKEKNESTKFNQEFHKKISALARYPHLMRLLGFIQDYKIKKDLVTKIDFLFRLNFDLVNFKKNNSHIGADVVDEFIKSVQFVCPYTRCEFDSTIDRLRAYYIKKEGDKKNNLANYNEIVKDGFILKKQFEVNQEYYENNSTNFQNKEKTKGDVVGFNGKVFKDEEIEVLKLKVNNENKISKGFAIKIKPESTELLRNMDSALNDLTDENIETGEKPFMAHHLDCGYRVDVRVVEKDENGKVLDTAFNSLCRREAKYIVDRKDDDIHLKILSKDFIFNNKNIELFQKLEDEPWLEEVRQVNDQGEQMPFEEITRWNNWSLTCPPLRKNHSADNPEYNDLELENIKPVKLPKLRFDKTYEFRIRTVDICGNGVNFETDSTESHDAEIIFTTKLYERKEQIGSPLLFPPYKIIRHLNEEKNEKKEIIRLYKGEDNETLVIRTNVIKDGAPSIINEECVRYITPPHITMHFAEVSGLLDTIFEETKNDKSELRKIYKFLNRTPKQYYKRDQIEDRPIPFLFDGEIHTIKFFDVNKSEINVESIPKFREKDEEQVLKNTKPIKLILKGSIDNIDNIYNKEETIANTIEFCLPIGKSKTYGIQSVSINKSLSPIKYIKLIHAVQRPFLQNLHLIDNTIFLGDCMYFSKIVPTKDTYKPEQQYQVKLVFISDTSNSFPFDTTGEFILSAEYQEYQLNPFNSEGWSYISHDHQKEKSGDSKPSSTNSDLEADKFYVHCSWSNFNEETEDDKLDTILTNGDLKQQEDKLQKNFNYFIHSFPDTNYRKVKYKIEAVSKYAEFFDIEEHDLDKKDPLPFSIFASLDKDGNDGNKYTIIKNSAKPSKPNITSIVPVFNTTKPDNNSYIFEHKCFRIYLGNSWYETGLDEKIAVIYKKKNLAEEDPNVKNKLTIIAKDPTTRNDSLFHFEESKPIISDNIYTDSVKNYIDSSKIHTDTLYISLLEIDKIEKSEKIEEKDTSNEYDFSAFTVHWDMEVKQFYADIYFNKDNLHSYSTMLKFAICRYQEHSIKNPFYDFRFSDVVMTDMVTLLPYREVCFDHVKDTITIEGIKGYRNSKEINPKNFSENQVYFIGSKLIKERNLIDFVSHIDKKDFESSLKIKRFDSYTFNYSSLGVKKNQKKYMPEDFDEIVIEEYENIELNDDFSMDDDILKNPNYNPRNDPRKRLVFFYKIK